MISDSIHVPQTMPGLYLHAVWKLSHTTSITPAGLVFFRSPWIHGWKTIDSKVDVFPVGAGCVVGSRDSRWRHKGEWPWASVTLGALKGYPSRTVCTWISIINALIAAGGIGAHGYMARSRRLKKLNQACFFHAELKCWKINLKTIKWTEFNEHTDAASVRVCVCSSKLIHGQLLQIYKSSKSTARNISY